MKKPKSSNPENEELRQQVEQLRQSLMHRGDRVTELEMASVKLAEENQRLHKIQCRQFDSMMIEKMDLMGRVARIDQRILALGLPPAVTATANLRVNHTPLD